MRRIIKQATMKEQSIIEEILFDAIRWMRQNGIENLWNECNSSWDALSKSYKVEQFYICYVEGQPAGCMALTEEDPKYWPEMKPGESLFIHKLAVKRQFAGNGIGSELIGYAKNLAYHRKIQSIRLDCNKDRKKLCALYEKQGFNRFKEINISNGYGMALYSYTLKSNPS